MKREGKIIKTKPAELKVHEKEYASSVPKLNLQKYTNQKVNRLKRPPSLILLRLDTMSAVRNPAW